MPNDNKAYPVFFFANSNLSFAAGGDFSRRKIQ